MSSKRENMSIKWSKWRASRELNRVENYKKNPIIREFLENDDDETLIQKIKKILLEKPLINKIERGPINRAEGNHHSKDFVAEIMNRIAVDKDISEFTLQIYHCEYDPHNKKHIIVSKLNDGSSCLRVFDEKVGYGAEIKLRCEHLHEAVLIAKYLVEKVNYFKKFNIKIDQKVLHH